MTNNPYAPLLPWCDTISESPDWNGGESSSVLIYPNTTQEPVP